MKTLEDNTVFRLEQGIGRWAKGEFSGELSFDICLNWRVYAMCRMLLDADTDGFAMSLVKSGQARIEYLSRRHQEAEPDGTWLCLSKNLPFEDCLAGGALHEARRVSELSPMEWFPDAEEEDEHRWQVFLHRFLRDAPGTPGPALTSALRDLEMLWGEDGEPRLEAARALSARDPAALAEAFEVMLDAREERIRKLRKTHGVPKDLLLTDGALYLEGLALLRLAELAGMNMPGEFRYLPGDARVPVRNAPLPPGCWLDVPRI